MRMPRKPVVVVAALLAGVAFTAALCTPDAAAATRSVAQPTPSAQAPATTVVPTTLPPPTLAPPAGLRPPVLAPIIVAQQRARYITVYRMPSTAKKLVTLDARTNFSGRHAFVVNKSEIAKDGLWYQVQVPVRPNGTVGYVRAPDVRLYQHEYTIIVSLSERTLTAFKGDRVILRETVAIGQPKYPTPLGLFFIRELARPSNPKGAYGPFAFGLSGYSNVLTRFGRGDGQLGVHGTNQPGLLGQAVSHGCIRINNNAITALAKILPQGVPIEIRP